MVYCFFFFIIFHYFLFIKLLNTLAASYSTRTYFLRFQYRYDVMVFSLCLGEPSDKFEISIKHIGSFLAEKKSEFLNKISPIGDKEIEEEDEGYY